MIYCVVAISLVISLVVLWGSWRWAYKAGYDFVKESHSEYGLTEEVQGIIDGCISAPVKKGMQKAAKELKGNKQ